jgi:hypothetical protein
LYWDASFLMSQMPSNGSPLEEEEEEEEEVLTSYSCPFT